MTGAAVLADRWECGSDFAYPDGVRADEDRLALPLGAKLFHSGRDALRALAAFLSPRPARILVPSYYCQEVSLALVSAGFRVEAYPDDPRWALPALDTVHLRPGDAIIVCNTFGLRAGFNEPYSVPQGVTVIEDHTHDPFGGWSRSSTAQYCYASLRKWLPIPDGGILWSNQSEVLPIPKASNSYHAAITEDKTFAMALKASYLNGGSSDKSQYRSLFSRAETRIGRLAPARMSATSRDILQNVPVISWRAQRLANYDVLASELSKLPEVGLMLLKPAEHCVPYAACLVMDRPEDRARLAAKLISSSIYPAVLWPIAQDRIKGVGHREADLANRILCIHCDHRYSAEDMVRVARTLSSIVTAG